MLKENLYLSNISNKMEIFDSNLLQKEIVFSILFYMIFILLFLPGYFIGDLILIPLYIYSTICLFQNKQKMLLQILIFWEYSKHGLYYYHLLGNETTILSRNFDEFVILLLLLSLFLKRVNISTGLKKNIKLTYFIIIVALFSGIINLVNPIDLTNYFTAVLRWIFVLIIVSTFSNKKDVFSLIVSILSITILNSILGLLQTVILPINISPDGYKPGTFDVAIGMMGVGSSQLLTTLCLSFSMLFILRYIGGVGKNNILYIILLMLQPAFSESKAALIISLSAIVLTMFLYVILRVGEFKSRIIVKVIIIGTLFFLCINIFKEMQIFFFGSRGSQYIENYFQSKNTINDYKKYVGYVEAFENIAPRGAVGILLGVGPTNFTSSVGLEKERELVKNLGLYEDKYVSSSEQRITDFTSIIGELGIVGLFIYLLVMIIIYLRTLKNIKHQLKDANKIFNLFTAQLVFIVIVFSIYSTGWLTSFFYFPMILALILVDRS